MLEPDNRALNTDPKRPLPLKPNRPICAEITRKTGRSHSHTAIRPAGPGALTLHGTMVLNFGTVLVFKKIAAERNSVSDCKIIDMQTPYHRFRFNLRATRPALITASRLTAAAVYPADELHIR